MTNILDVRWFQTVGIVRIEDKYEGIKYYIGRGVGEDEQVDREYIANWGSSFPKSAGDALFGINQR
jgi:hypothetical protein